MECDFEGCNKMSCASTSVWLKTGGLHVKYWCKEHTPQDDTSLDWHCWANAMTVGCCNECELEAAEQERVPDAAKSRPLKWSEQDYSDLRLYGAGE